MPKPKQTAPDPQKLREDFHQLYGSGRDFEGETLIEIIVSTANFLADIVGEGPVDAAFSKLTHALGYQTANDVQWAEALQEQAGGDAYGSKAVRTDATLLSHSPDGRDKLYYVPFEHMNWAAKLVIVGITPGPNQMDLAYQAVQASLKGGLGEDLVLERAKKAGSFGAKTMRPNLIKMLNYFGIPALLSIARADDLWDISGHDLHATSIVPHAAFRNGKPFAGTFKEVMGSRIFRECFERDFASSLPMISSQARYIALGPTPLAALDWCCEQGLIKADQILGAFAHPSGNGGSQVAIYLGERRIDDLSPGDPVRKRDWLISLAERMSRSVARWKTSIVCA